MKYILSIFLVFAFKSYSCEIKGPAEFWSYDNCFWKHETDDSLNPNVIACVDYNSVMIEKLGNCNAKKRFKFEICVLNEKYNNESLSACLATNEPLGPAVRNSGI